MPPPLDLTGRRFGKLTALRRIPNPKRTTWRLICDCGRETDAPLGRLNTADDDPRAIRACHHCRSRQCVVCGERFLKSGSAKTCGRTECRLENRRATNQRAAAAADQRNPGRAVARRKRRYTAVMSDALRAEAQREYQREYARQRRANMTDEDRQARRAWEREYYAKNKKRVQARFQQWLANLPPDRRRAWDEMMKKSGQRYRSRKAIARMMAEAKQLIEMTESDDGTDEN